MRIDLIHEDVNAENVERFGIRKGEKFSLIVVRTDEEELPENLRWFFDEDPVLKIERPTGAASNTSRNVEATNDGLSEIRIYKGDEQTPVHTLWVTVFSNRAASFGLNVKVETQ